MCALRCLLAAGVAALSLAPYEASAAAQPGAANGWWYAGRAGEAPQRQLVFIDRGTVRAQGGEASARVMAVFEQPRGGMKAFAMTYAFRCAARQFQTRDAVFTTIANRQEAENGLLDDWSAVVPGSVAATLLDAACHGRFDREARRIAAAPMVEASRIFRGEIQSAAAPQRGPARRSAPRAGGGLLTRDELLRCMGAPSNAVSDWPACREVRGLATRAPVVPAGPGRPQMQCRGTLYSRGNADGSFAADLSFAGGQAVLSLRPDAYRFSGRYPFSQSGGRIDILMRNNITVSYFPGTGELAFSFVNYWEDDDIDPRNPFPVEYSARIDYRATCS